MQFDGQTLIKCDFLEGRLPKLFFRKYVFLVVSKLYTKFQQFHCQKLPSSNILSFYYNMVIKQNNKDNYKYQSYLDEVKIVEHRTQEKYNTASMSGLNFERR